MANKTEELSSFIQNTIEKHNPETATIIIMEHLHELNTKVVSKITFNPPVIGCYCPSESRTGWTEVKCCNQCGRPIDKLWGKN